MNAICKNTPICRAGKGIPPVIVSESNKNKYFIHCPNCDSLYIAKKPLFSSTLKNEHTIPLVVLIEYINCIYDNSNKSIKNIIDTHNMSVVFKYLVSHGYMIINDELGCENKDGKFDNEIAFYSFHCDDNKKRKDFRDTRMKTIQEAKNNPLDPTDIKLHWNKCY